MSAANPLLEAQLSELRKHFPDAEVAPLPDGTALVTLPAIPLGAGWNQEQTTAWFLVPVGYPVSRPDCFFADGALRPSGERMPMNTGFQPLPGTADNKLWFSWHLQAWNPSQDGLLAFARVVRDRLGRAQ